MDQNTLLLIFVGISTIALVFQAAMLYGTYKASRTLQERIVPLVPKIEALVPKIEALVDTSRSTIEENALKFREITDKASQILDSAKRQMEAVESLLDDASEQDPPATGARRKY